jgi:hypothetical protein
VLSLVLLLTALASFPALASASDPLAFCTDRVVHDYELPLRSMPADHPPPKELPFGSRRLSISRLGFDKLALPGETFGYRFGGNGKGIGRNAEGRLLHPLSLHWNVITTLWAVDRHGRLVRVVARKHRYFNEVHNLMVLEFALAVRRAGLYRIGLSFKKPDGTLLGSYNEYVRAIPRQVSMRIATSQPEFHLGETALGRFENLGTEDVQLPEEGALELERYEDGQWIQIPRILGEGVAGWTGDVSVISGGDATSCYKVELPPGTTTGLYRFSVAAKPFGSRTRTVTGQFMVLQ